MKGTHVKHRRIAIRSEGGYRYACKNLRHRTCAECRVKSKPEREKTARSAKAMRHEERARRVLVYGGA